MRLHGAAGADEVFVAVDMVDAADGRPVFVVAGGFVGVGGGPGGVGVGAVGGEEGSGDVGGVVAVVWGGSGLCSSGRIVF